ncbi:MAG: peptide deformylase [Candidatus Vogelbacteria bacterium CG22_combo_CG10-13_8_21_14_all_37_9]|uniref:Peptide deformylase n=1 Tax=Candidatus Vogelbacteria bacterium CG22_combo_CG10-13_8_21_14_all_37_9 TaxID=1975046 RepID=A0A2H0BL12_9BACT|nr:MAG: peptide deformylase [bacterium CG10_37_50]PIP58365.1 MAG: peptide deformylase [Candidatus Vogelbacteria bacterium CG22_combo_CG10-13_8_21_14_all_37_9]
MAKNPIIQKDQRLLRAIAKEVPLEQISQTKIKHLLTKMKTVLAEREDGAALAAPQIGVSLRIFIVSKRIFGDESKTLPAKLKTQDLVFINPVLIKLSKKKKKLEEGCLSVQGVFGKIERSEKAQVEAYNENGQKISYSGSGLLAQIFQHEIDHLNGILFIDKAKNLIKVD